MVTQLAALLKRNFPYALFFWKGSSELLLVAGSERLDSKGPPSETRKTSKDQKETFACALQNSRFGEIQNNQETVTITKLLFQ